MGSDAFCLFSQEDKLDKLGGGEENTGPVNLQTINRVPIQNGGKAIYGTISKGFTSLVLERKECEKVREFFKNSGLKFPQS